MIERGLHAVRLPGTVGTALAIGNCGIYRERFGVRAEDTVWVGPEGPIELTHYPKRPLA
jgi:hypothetical protein